MKKDRGDNPPARFFGPEKFKKGNIKKDETFRLRDFRESKAVFIGFDYEHPPPILIFKIEQTGATLNFTPKQASRTLFKYEKARP